MKEFLLPELRNAARQILEKNDYLTENNIRKKEETIVKTIWKAIELRTLGWREGFLALEEETTTMNLGKNPECRYFPDILNILVDGYPEEEILEMALPKFYADDLQGYEALQFLLTLEGVLLISQEKHDFVMEQKLTGLLPKPIRVTYEEMKAAAKENENDSVAPRKLDMSVVEKYYKGGLELGTATWEGLTAAVLDAALKELPERDISRLLCYTSSISMEVALRGLSGETRKKVFSCMSKRLAFTMAEYLDNAGTMKVTEIGEACAKILNDAQRLMEHGDILDINKDLIDRTNSYIQAKSAQPPDRKMVHAAGKELVKVLNTYMGKDNLVIAPVKKEQEPEEERGYEDR